MNGSLLAESGIDNGISFFLTSHSIMLLGFFWFKKKIINKTAPIFIVLTSLLTIFFPYTKYFYRISLFFIGLTSAFFVLKVVSELKFSKNPSLYSALGLSIGTVLLFLMCKLSFLSLEERFFIVGILPLVSLFNKKDNTDEYFYQEKLNISYTPFIYFFYLIGGIMYGFIMPAYQKTCFFEGFELIYYIVACFLGYLLMKFDKVVVIFGGIIFGMLAFSFVQIEKNIFYNISMFFLQSAFGMIEVFILVFVLEQSPVHRAISALFTSMCLGILSGNFITLYLSEYTGVIATVGNIFLTISSGILLFTERRKKYKGEVKTENSIKENKAETENNKEDSIKNIEYLDGQNYFKVLKRRLSPKEFEVFKLFIAKKTYKEIAEELGLSESTVKTYMKRIFDKEGVAGKKELLEKLGHKINE
ncbi:MAG: LuxR C-terminal-related transcriptional regulator [Proteobacteria bacterium]|nr:LuxR C-terminal-related transcriptional regulator [Pseudomonadota bacterium]